MSKTPTFADLRYVDVTSHMEKKAGFTYLSWPFAIEQLFIYYPDARWAYKEAIAAPDDSVLIEISLHLDNDGTKLPYILQHPVLDYRNKPITNPNCFDVNTANMRGLTKLISMATGIGLHIYAGEDLPPEDDKQPPYAECAHDPRQGSGPPKVKKASTPPKQEKAPPARSGDADESPAVKSGDIDGRKHYEFTDPETQDVLKHKKYIVDTLGEQSWLDILTQAGVEAGSKKITGKQLKALIVEIDRALVQCKEVDDTLPF